MPRRRSNSTPEPPSHDARAMELLRSAAIAVTLFDPVAARALFEIPDAELGRRFKRALVRVAGLATVLDIDQRSILEESTQRREDLRANQPGATPRRLVANAKLLHKSHFCAAIGFTPQKVDKEVAAHRIFSVDIDDERYFPAFFLVEQIRRKDLAKVVQTLHAMAGWSKWNFFTTPRSELADLTPLQALFYGDRKRVLRVAAESIER
ncbi:MULTISPECIES: hypothetical protein [Paraburkholderia]|uniref:Uncharacterized protein n=2 Tax=Paraburkholderia TaxID=1822464 RepID=A0A7T4T884_9BURK|nr:hypothetical protein [Paraburkholderia ginsengisoli]QQC63185.1 hypothetical protein I6I06_12830 [Paraburkholderia ginsengisoli]